MTFESLWPLLFTAAVPVIIILYLLKPKGVDHLISSNLLWKKLLKNEQSRTFFEKFVHNILMYLQILIIGLLVLALMSPIIRMDGKAGGRKILLIDTSGSMQHVGASGKSRLEEAVEQAGDYVRTADNSQFCIVTVDGVNTELLAVDITDGSELNGILQKLVCSDGGGSLTAAQGLLDTLAGDEAESAASLIVYTDGAGAGDFEKLERFSQKELHVVGSPTSNIANEYTVFSKGEMGLYDVMVSLRNYSGEAASMDVGLYDENEKLIALSQMQIAAEENGVCLFEQVDWQGQELTAKVSGIQFASGSKDSLAADNVSHAVKNSGDQINGLLVGDGNTFVEKAYLAVTGADIAKADSDAAAGDDRYNVVIYDAEQIPQEDCNKLIFGDPRGEAEEQLDNVVLNVADCDLTEGLSDFTIGVNHAYSFVLPEGARSFLEYNGKCVGYYGERDGSREVVVGFDMRESDFPLRAEFPVFLANAMIYLSDSSWLVSNTYYVGEEVALQPWAEPDRSRLESRPVKAGLYHLGNEKYQEAYVVRFLTGTESDGRAQAESVLDSGEFRMQKVRRTLRNLFLILALLLLAAEWIIYIRQMRYHGVFYYVVRGAVFLCLILALAGIQIRLGSNQTATVFVVDLSNSNEQHLEEMEEYLRREIDKMPSGNVYGIVSFGKDALVEQFLTEEHAYGGLMTLPEKTSTNFEEAVSRALTLIPGDANGRLVVLTDGKETRGNIQNTARALTASKAELLTLLYEDEMTDDVYIENVSLPSYLHPGDKYSATVRISSNYDTDAVVNVYHGSVKSAAYNVHLNKGSNRFVFSDQVSEDAGNGAMEDLRIQVEAPGDTCFENNNYSAYSVVEAAPRVLVIAGRNSNASAFTTVLNAAGCDYSVVSAANAPDTIDDMLAYKSIILVNTYAGDLPQGFLDHLETYVKDYGCGFICCGGEDSYALGGYRGTALETVLPVDMRLKSVNEMQTMAMVMVIDHSGSMLDSSNGATNLDIAIKSATVAVDNLQDTDTVGVLTFDDQFEWQVEPTLAADRQTIKDEIEQIKEGGGTTIKPALQEAYRAISECDASVKHVVLLTDGMGETTDYSDVIKNYTDSGITMSTVAVGDGSDTRLLENLAKNCGGRYYYSDISTDIPKIFAQEVFLGGDSYIQNGQFALSVRKSHELTANLFPEGWPMLYGYVAASPKTASNVIISAVEKDSPILTVWQYGLGRTVAWNSDVTGEWSGAFSGREDYVKLWKRIVDYSVGNAGLGEDRVDVVTAGEVTTVVYQTEDYNGKTEILATMMNPDGEAEEVKLHATAPGKYEAELETSQVGLYHFNIRRTENGEILNYLTTAAAVQFSDEYKFDVGTDAYLGFAQRYGRMIATDDNIWTRITAGARGKRSLTNLLLALAICLFLADVAMRRFQYEPHWRIPVGKKAVSQEEGTREEDGHAPGKQEMQGLSKQEERDPEGAGTKKQKPGPEKKKKASGSGEQTLDTSQLLKKKDDRNI